MTAKDTTSGADTRNRFERNPLAHEIPEVIALARVLVAKYLMNPGTPYAFVACRTPEFRGKTNAERRKESETLDALERLRELIGRDETLMRRECAERAARLKRLSSSSSAPLEK